MSDKMILVRPRVRALATELFPGWRVAVPCDALAGYRFDRIVVAFTPDTDDERRWIDESVSCRLRPGSVLEFLA